MSDAFPAPDDEAPFDASRPAHVKKRRDDAKRADMHRDAMLRAMMEQPQGRQWLWWLLEQTNIFQSSFSQNALMMAHREGARNVGLVLLAEITRVAPEFYVQMIKEKSTE